ncbi:MAG: serine/threonine-protein kinase [Polyangiaceae bacterium]
MDRAVDHRAKPGDVIAGRYRIENILGQGGMAIVFLAKHVNTGKPCALKLVHPHLVSRRELIELFVREAQVGGRIGDHPNIVNVFDAGEDTTRRVPYLAMELLEGETLEDYMERAGVLPKPEVRTLLLQLGDALDQAHRAGVVHRDLKPGNLFVTRDRHGAPVLKVMDFGIAKVLEMEAQRTATQVGTPAYAAPEQLGAGFRKAAAKNNIVIDAGVTPMTDVWALGLIAYELLTGHPTGQYWGAETIVELPMKVALEHVGPPSARAADRAQLLPAGFDGWFDRCIRKNAQERWPTMGQAVEALVRLLDGQPAVMPTQRVSDVMATVPFSPTAGGPAPGAFGPGATEAPGAQGYTQPGHTPAPGPGYTQIPQAGWSGAGQAATPAGAWGASQGGGMVPYGSGASSRSRQGDGSASKMWLIVLGVLAGVFVVGFGGCAALRFAMRSGAAKACATGSWEQCKQACELSDQVSCRRLAAHDRNIGLNEEAADQFEVACDAGDLRSCVELGRMLEIGRARLKDEAKARELYQRACDAGDMYGCANLAGTHVYGLPGEAKDEKAAVDLYSKACDAGDTYGCTNYALMQFWGKGGLPKNDAEVAAMLQRACDAGDMWGCLNLGGLHEFGNGVPLDERRAMVLYERACSDAERYGCSELGELYAEGKAGLTKDPQKAVELYKKSCDAYHGEGCTRLALAYYTGTGVARDERKTAEILERACDANSGEGCSNLGSMHSQGSGGLVQDKKKAADLFERACQLERAPACRSLGFLYEQGDGGMPKDEAKAAQLYQRACDAGDMSGCTYVGMFHEEGTGGLPKDVVKAVELYRKSCDGGGGYGCYHLAQAYLHGDGGLSKDEREAAKLAEQACNASSMVGCNLFGVLLHDGTGVTRDYGRAISVYTKACDEDVYAACSNLGKMIADGEGTRADRARGASYLRKGCNGGNKWGCERLREMGL